MSNNRKNNNRFGPMGSPGTLEKPKDFKNSFKQLTHQLSIFKLPLLFVLIFTLFSTIFAIIGPKLLGNATTEVFNGIMAKIQGTGGIDFDKIGIMLFILIGLYLFSLFFSFMQGFIMSKVAQTYTYNLRKKVSLKINKLPMSYFDKKTHGETLSIITNDIDMLNQGLSQSAVQIISSVATIIGVIIMMLSIDWAMTLVSILILPLSFVFVGLIIKKSQKHFIKQQEYLGHVNGSIEEMYSGHIVVKAFNAEKKVINEFEKNNNHLYNSAWKSQFLSGLMQPIIVFVGNFGYVVVSILGGYFAVNGRITIGNIQSFIQYSRNSTQTIAQLASVSSSIQSMFAASERVFNFLNEAEEETVNKNNINIEALKGEVKFENVIFGYNEDKTIIKNFNIKVKEGQKVAIVGPTGAGKTTIVKLLMKFYKVNKGNIFVDNINLNELTREQISNLFGMVLQDTWLFSDTIMENLRYGQLNATDDEVIEAAKTARIHHFIQTLPNGYNMELNEEMTNISQGEKQLLTIARAILSDPKILILDEATSSVDTRTEALIQQAMDELVKGRTTFVIAHRLSTIKNADVILVINDGDIVEQGNHNELIKKNGFYANLYNSQFDTL